MKANASLIKRQAREVNALRTLCDKMKQEKAEADASSREVEGRSQRLVRVIAERDEEIRKLVAKQNLPAKKALKQAKAKDDLELQGGPRPTKRPKMSEPVTRRVQPFRQCRQTNL